jgi:MoaA/NifB/PqqE/SkfB family radical SAM enzyme
MTTIRIDKWSNAKKWNPYNSDKLLAQVYRWSLIREGEAIPQPSLVTVDPVYSCNLTCVWCNSESVIRRRRGLIDREGFMKIADGLAGWKGSPDWKKGVDAVCIAGGGEPLLNRDVGDFIVALVERGIDVGVVTNGYHIDRFIPQLALCTWVGVSVDAGSEETYTKLKGQPVYTKVCDNIRRLTAYSRENKCRLGQDSLGSGVSYKFLLYNGNSKEIIRAARMAKELGCRSFHLRPAGTPWDRLGSGKGFSLDEEVKKDLSACLESARAIEDESFGVYGITHKFTNELTIANTFETCHAVFMTAVFIPPKNHEKGSFSVGLCCDRRGDESLEFTESFRDFGSFEKNWGSKRHWEMHRGIDLSRCPRCTYQPHNQIFEHVVKKDNMTYKFI